jgi:hypothetical protein
MPFHFFRQSVEHAPPSSISSVSGDTRAGNTERSLGPQSRHKALAGFEIFRGVNRQVNLADTHSINNPIFFYHSVA